MQAPAHVDITPYMLSRERLLERKALEARIKTKCIKTGMAYDVARQSVLQEVEDETMQLTTS